MSDNAHTPAELSRELPGEKILNAALEIIENIEPIIVDEMANNPNVEGIMAAAVKIRDISQSIFERASGIQIEEVALSADTDASAGSDASQASDTATGDEPLDTDEADASDTSDTSDTPIFMNEDVINVRRAVSYLHSSGKEKTMQRIIKRVFGARELTDDEYQRFNNGVQLAVAADMLTYDGRHFMATGERPEASEITTLLAEKPAVSSGDTPEPATPEIPSGAEELSPLDEELLTVLQSPDAGEGLRMEEIRRAIPDLIELNAKDYSNFKSDFSNRTDKLIAHLAENGIDAYIEKTGRNRGRRYRLVQGPVPTLTPAPSAPPLQAGTPVVPSAPQANPEQAPTEEKKQPATTAKEQSYYDRVAATRAAQQSGGQELTPQQEHAQLRRAARFATRLTIYVQSELEDAPEGKLKIKDVVDRIAKELPDVTSAMARTAINSLIAQKHIHKNGNHRGSPMLSNEAPSGESTVPSRETNAAGESLLFSKEEMVTVKDMLTKLVADRHWERGLKIKSFYIDDEAKKKQINDIVNKMRKSGKIERFQPKRQKAAHSRRSTEPYVRFTDNAAWKYVKANLDDFIDELAEMTE